MSIKLKTLLDNCNILSLIIANSIMRSTVLQMSMDEVVHLTQQLIATDMCVSVCSLVGEHVWRLPNEKRSGGSFLCC